MLYLARRRSEEMEGQVLVADRLGRYGDAEYGGLANLYLYLIRYS